MSPGMLSLFPCLSTTVFCDSTVIVLISVQTCLVDRINNVFPSRSLYGVSLWRNKVLTGSVPFAFRDTRFRQLYIFLLLVACRLIFFFSLPVGICL